MKNLHRIVDVLLSRPSRQATGITLATALGLTSFAFAGGPGSTTAQLLEIPIGARAVGMGEAYTAMADDASSLEWNPAGLALANQQEASFMHSSLIENVNYEHLAYIHPGTSYSVGGSMSYLGYGSIAGYNNTGESIGNQSAYSSVYNAGVATQFWQRFSAGLTGSFIHEKLALDSASTVAMNAGALYDVAQHPWLTNYRLGFSMLNLGPGLKFVSDREPLPQTFKIGAAAMQVHNLPLNLTLDVSVPNNNSPYVSFGSEYWFRELLALRLGYTGENTVSNGFRFGLGLKIRQILFDYAYGSFGDFGATHRIQLAFRFGERAHQMNGEERAILKSAKTNIKQGDYAQAIIGLNEVLDKDPENQNVLKQMITVHEALLKKQLNESEAATASDKNEGIPSPEEFALQDLVPGQQNAAKPAALPPGDDPLGLEGLPDASNLNTAELMTTPAFPAAEKMPPKNIEAPRAVEKTVNVEAPLAVESKHTAAKTKEVGAPVVPTMAPVDNGPDRTATGVAVTPQPSQENTSAGDGTLVNPNDIYGN